MLVPAVLLASFWAWVRAIRGWREGRPLVPYEPRRPVPWGPWVLLFGAGLYVLLPVLASAWVCRWSGVAAAVRLQDLEPAMQMRILAAAALASLLAAAVTGLVIYLGTGCSGRDLGWEARRIAGDVRLGFRAFFLLAPPVYLIQIVLVQWFPSEHPLIELLQRQPDLRWLLVSGLVAVITAPLVEEFFFRLVLQGWLEKLGSRVDGGVSEATEAGSPADQPVDGEEKPVPLVGGTQPLRPGGLDNPYAPPSVIADAGFDGGVSSVGAAPSRWPILCSALVFAVMHASHGPDPIPLFVLAVGLGYLYHQTHRLLPSIMVHLLLNLTTMFALAAELYG